MDIVENINELLGLDVDEAESKETKPYTEVSAKSLSNSVDSVFKTTSSLIPVIFCLLIIWKCFWFVMRSAFRTSVGEPIFATDKPKEMTDIKAEKSTSTYVKRIDKLLENAKDEKEAVVSLKMQVEKLYEKRDQLTGYACAEINRQLTDVGKYIAMFEEVQNERKRTELNSHAKHVLDKVWD